MTKTNLTIQLDDEIIRRAKILAAKRGTYSVAYFMESPPLQLHDGVARERVGSFIRGDERETLTGEDGEVRLAQRIALDAALVA